MKEKTAQNKATLGLLRSNVRRGVHEWASAKKVPKPHALCGREAVGTREGRAQTPSP